MMLKIFGHFIPASILILALCEISLIFLVWHIYFSGYPVSAANSNILVKSPALFLALIAVGVMALSGLYHNKAFANFRLMAIQIAVTFGLLYAAALGGDFFFKIALGEDNYFGPIEQKVVFIWLLCILITRTVFLRLADRSVFKKRVLILGSGHRAARIAALAAARGNRYFVPVAFLHTGNDPRIVDTVPTDIKQGGADVIADAARQFGATEIVVATDDRRGLPVKELLRCRAAGMRVIDYLDFIERQTKTVDLSALQPGWLIFSDGFRGSPQARLAKRIFDILASGLLLLFSLPLMLLAALAIILDSAGPVLYRQERVGLGGRPFVLLKFRSMRTDAEKDGAQWAATRDPRVTRVGGLIRKLRIDELPQLVNVLKGDMSLVGPRPERPAFVDGFVNEIPFYAERHCVKPGITGWAQINHPYGASLEDARDKLSYDLYYVKNHGLFLDIVIVLQTVRVILWADGSR